MDKERLTTELDSSMSTLNEKVNETEKQSELIVELEDHVEKLQDHVNRGEAEGRSSTGMYYLLQYFRLEIKPYRLSSSIRDMKADLISW